MPRRPEPTEPDIPKDIDSPVGEVMRSDAVPPSGLPNSGPHEITKQSISVVCIGKLRRHLLRWLVLRN